MDREAVVVSADVLRKLMAQEGAGAAEDILYADSLLLAERGWSVPELLRLLRDRNAEVGSPLTERRMAEIAAETFRRSQFLVRHKDYPDSDPDLGWHSLISEVDSFDAQNLVQLGIDALDEELGGLLPGECMSLVGAEGSMKTALALHAAETVLTETELRVLFLSLDMPPEKVLVRRLMRELRMSESEVRSHIQGRSELFQRALADIRNRDAGRFRIVGKPKGARYITLEHIVASVEAEMPNVLILDYLTKIQSAGGRFLSSDLERTQEVVPALHAMATDFKISSIWLSQMGRASKAAARTGDHGGHAKGGGIVEETVDVEVELVKDALDEDMPKSKRPIVAAVTKTRRGVAGRAFALAYDGRSISFSGHAKQVQRVKKSTPIYEASAF